MDEPATITDLDNVLVVRISAVRLFDPSVVQRVDLILRQAITQRRQLVIDISVVRFLSSAMLGRLVLLWQDLDAQHLRLALCGASQTIAEVMRISGLDYRIPRYPTQTEALTALRTSRT